MGIHPNFIQDILNEPRDEASKVSQARQPIYPPLARLRHRDRQVDSFVWLPIQVLVAICTASGARSSSHSEILQQIGPPLELVDDSTDTRLPPGGFSEWGLKRQGACIALGNKAFEHTAAFFRGKPTFRMLTVALVASGLSTSAYGGLTGRRVFNTMAINVWRGVMADVATTTDQRALLMGSMGLTLLGRDYEYAIACGGSLE